MVQCCPQRPCVSFRSDNHRGVGLQKCLDRIPLADIPRSRANVVLRAVFQRESMQPCPLRVCRQGSLLLDNVSNVEAGPGSECWKPYSQQTASICDLSPLSRRETLESEKHTGLLSDVSLSNAAAMLVINLDSNKAESSSSLGMVMPPTGVTLVFAAINFTSINGHAANRCNSSLCCDKIRIERGLSSLSSIARN